MEASSNPSASLDDFAKRPMRYWSQDGLPDLLLGLMLVVPGIVFLAGEALPKASFSSQAYSFVAPWVWLGCTLALVRIFKRLKERIIFPRAGYVALPDPTWRYWAAMVASAVLFGNGMAFLWLRWNWLSGPGVALLMVTTLMIGAVQYRLPHMLWLAMVALLLGVATYQVKTGMEGGLWVLVGLGIAMSLTGAWKLRNFLKANPRSEQPAPL
jgi:hypothetical protein